MKGPDVHLIHVDIYIMLYKFIGNPGQQLFGRFFCKGHNHDFIWFYMPFHYKVGNPFYQGKGLPCTRSGYDKQWPFCFNDRLPLFWISASEIKHSLAY